MGSNYSKQTVHDPGALKSTNPKIHITFVHFCHVTESLLIQYLRISLFPLFALSYLTSSIVLSFSFLSFFIYYLYPFLFIYLFIHLFILAIVLFFFSVYLSFPTLSLTAPIPLSFATDLYPIHRYQNTIRHNSPYLYLTIYVYIHKHVNRFHLDSLSAYITLFKWFG